MESVLATFVTLFVTLFAVLTLSGALLSTQDTLRGTRVEMEARLGDQARTNLAPMDVRINSAGTVLEFTYRNAGTTRLTDFKNWDVIIQYFDTADPAAYHLGWLPYTESTPASLEWTVEGIYLNANDAVKESFEPGMLNPGEELVVQLRVSPALGRGKTIQAVLAAQNGVAASTIFARNVLPVLATNAGLIVITRQTGVMGNTKLKVTDADDAATKLVYSVVTSPTQGALSLGTTFTQYDIDNGQLKYTHTGSAPGSDSFTFTVTDGKESIGPFTFNITIANAAPVLAANAGLAVAEGATGTIGSTKLAAMDIDDPIEGLVFAVTSGPSKGTLSLGSSFTQADINAGLVTYARTAPGADSFTFTISDGEATVGPFTFTISVP